MGKISKGGSGKTLYIQPSIYRCGNSHRAKNLTISCPDENTRFRTTLSEYGLGKFKDCILRFYKEQVLERTEQEDTDGEGK